MKFAKAALSLLLILCLVLPMVPVYAAETDQSAAAPSVEVTVPPAEEAVTQASSLRLDDHCQILRYVDEEVFRSRDHIARFETEETLSSYVFLNRDGTKTVYYMDEPVKFRDAGGRVWEKDLTLTAADDGYTTACNDVSLTLPEDPASGIRLGHGGKQIALIPQGGALAEAAAVTDSTVTYPDYFGDGMSLRYTPTLSGVKEDIILDAYAGVSSFTFTLNTGGLNLYQAGGSWFLAENKTAASRIELGDIVAFDAHGRFSIGTMTAETVMPGQSYCLTLTVDEAFLTDESTTYPVTIDPTLTATDGTVTTTAIEDATVYSGSTSLNTGDWLYHHIGYYDATYGTGETVVRLSGLLSSDVYAMAEANWFTEAKFYVNDASGNDGQTVHLYPMVSNTTWTESGITWANKGSRRTAAVDSATLAAGGQGAFDILSLLQDWKNEDENANAGFILVADASNTAISSLYSSEHGTSAKRPYVVVTYQNDVWINTDVAEMDAGAKVTLTAGTKIEGDTITWTSADTSIATVTQTGDYTCQVTGVRSGNTTVTATLPNGQTATCEIYVTITDGTYFIGHSSGLYLGVDQGVLNGSPVELLSKKSSGPQQLRQIWKIQHIERNLYSIRSVYRLDMSLNVTDSTAVDVAPLGTDLTPQETPGDREWKIIRQGDQYTFGYAGTQALTITAAEESPTSGSDLAVVSRDVFDWSLEWESVSDQILLLNTTTGLPAQDAVRYVAPGETKTLAEMNLMATFVSRSTNEQDLVWSVPVSTAAVVERETGTVTGVTYRDTPSIHVFHRTLSVDSASYTLSVTNTPTSPPLKYQEEEAWCWIAAAQMFAMYYYPNITLSQYDGVIHVIDTVRAEAEAAGEEIDIPEPEKYSGTPENIVEAIKYYIQSVSLRPGNIVTTPLRTVITEDALVGYLDSNNPVIIGRGRYTGNSLSGTRYSGHAMLVYDYVEIYGENYFLVLDPWPVGEGNVFRATYEELREYTYADTGSTYFWDIVIAVYSEYIFDRIELPKGGE